MKQLLPLLGLLLLTACGTVAKTDTLEEQLQNPLLAEQYWEDLVDRMAMLIINKTYENDPAKHAYADRIREEALAHAQAATKKRGEGIYGSFVSVSEGTQGLALLVDNTLSFGPGFITYPGPTLHVYLTTMVDPRDGAFPDDTAIDLGLLHTPYGPQQFTTPDVKILGEGAIRTVVLFDTKLERLYGFAQLGK